MISVLGSGPYRLFPLLKTVHVCMFYNSGIIITHFENEISSQVRLKEQGMHCHRQTSSRALVAFEKPELPPRRR